MIDPTGIFLGLLVMLFFMALGLNVAVGLFATGVLGLLVYASPAAMGQFGTLAWSVQNDPILLAIPLFILLGEILLRIGVTDRMYAALSDWFSWLPGGLLHTNIAASTVFAAVTGSSVATAATIGTVALPTFRRRGYNERLVLGSISAGGTLGILIPPSVNMIVYGAMTDTSISALFLAGIIPGLALAALFMLFIAIICLVRPDFARREAIVDPLGVRLRRLTAILPVGALIGLVIGSIYLGWATPSESAAVGVVGALVLAVAYRRLNLQMLYQSFESMLRTTGMLMLVVVCAFFLNFAIALLGVPEIVTDVFVNSGLSPMQIMWLLIVFYLVLGTFMDGMSMMIATVPILLPVIVHAGFDPVWFGVVLVILMEAALISPPVGMNLFVLQSIRGRGSINDVFIGATPFMIPMFVLICLCIWFPQIVLWLPQLMRP